jgi:hypothetical protein
MAADERFPLPMRQYRWYVLFFHVLTLGSLVGGLAYVLWNARDNRTSTPLPTGLTSPL